MGTTTSRRFVRRVPTQEPPIRRRLPNQQPVNLATSICSAQDAITRSGKPNAVGRRERELAIQLPDRANVVHAIKTNDPHGIDAYWYRKNGEWFSLNAADVQAFKRRKFM